MRIGGVVAEFNPFHNGHAALGIAARERGITHLVAVMSGNLVQRGDIAITEKRVRAASALRSGFDLVLELPAAWACSTAQTFARGAVGILAACGCIDALCFGSECADPGVLRSLSRAVDDPRVEMVLRMRLAQGMTFAKARAQAVEEVFGAERSARLSGPNDLLGVEYLRQAGVLGWEPEVIVLRREGAAHDAKSPLGRISSASHLRARADNLPYISRYMPEGCAELLSGAADDGLFPARLGTLETAILARLRMLEISDLAGLPDISEGLENRLSAAIRSSGSVAALASSLKTKRYTMARVRRLILSAFFGLTAGDAAGTPPYLRILGFNDKGREILARIGKTSALPCEASLARLRGQGGRCERTALLESRVTDLYSLALPLPLPCGYDLTARVEIRK